MIGITEMSANDIDLDYAKECWSIANSVTVFAVLQMIAYLLSAGSSNSTIRDGILRVRSTILGLIVLSTLLYLFFVWLLANCQIGLLQSIGDKKVIALILYLEIARMVAIGFSGILGFGFTLTIEK